MESSFAPGEGRHVFEETRRGGRYLGDTEREAQMRKAGWKRLAKNSIGDGVWRYRWRYEPEAAQRQYWGETFAGIVGLIVVALIVIGPATSGDSATSGSGNASAAELIRDFCDGNGYAVSTRQTCFRELTTYFALCRIDERERGIALRDTSCVDAARDGREH
jgi:hypothetical protein